MLHNRLCIALLMLVTHFHISVYQTASAFSRTMPRPSLLNAGSFASVARSEASFMSSVGGSRSKEQALADTYARASARLKALEVCFEVPTHCLPFV